MATYMPELDEQNEAMVGNMKKKISVFATGWSEQMLDEYMRGIRSGLEGDCVDVYLFLCYPALTDGDIYSNGELNIFTLPDLNDFDGALVLGNGIDYPEAIKSISERCKNAQIPLAYTGCKLDEGYYIGSDNYFGARKLSEHLYFDHGLRDFFFIAGSKENMDSNIRLEALRDVICENGGDFPEDRVFYTDWNPRIAMLFIEDWIMSERPLPEAFVCANDEMAILMCDELRKHGKKVPDDVKVTGFDNLIFAQVYDPSISSVSQNFDKIGYESIQTLKRLWNNETCERELMVPCEFHPSESCGCGENSTADSVRREIGRNRFMDNLNNSAFYRKLAVLDRYIMKGDCYEDLTVNFKGADEAFNFYEGKSYHVVLDPIYKDKMNDLAIPYNICGYASKMDVIFSVSDGNYASFKDFDTRQIVPQISNAEQNHLYICLPLQYDGGCMGYVIFADDYSKFRDSELLGKYATRLSAILSKFQHTINSRILNERLVELSETDALTKVKNRTAYQVRANKLDNKIASGCTVDFAVLLCDVNNLKKVNDKWGHESGDAYITNSCKLICDTFKKSAVYRIGGDEFAVLLEGEDYERADALIDTINHKMHQLAGSDIPVWDQVSVAVGIARYDADTDTCVADVLNRADEVMYARKVEMKKE